MKKYLALFEYAEGENGFGVVFPDLPGCFSAGDDYDDAYRMAHEALAFHLEGLKIEKYPIPEPRTMEQIKDRWEEWKDWEKKYKFLVVPISFLPTSEKSVRINVMLSAPLVASIDSVATNRSAFIEAAARNYLENGKTERKHA